MAAPSAAPAAASGHRRPPAAAGTATPLSATPAAVTCPGRTPPRLAGGPGDRSRPASGAPAGCAGGRTRRAGRTSRRDRPPGPAKVAMSDVRTAPQTSAEAARPSCPDARHDRAAAAARHDRARPPRRFPPRPRPPRPVTPGSTASPLAWAPSRGAPASRNAAVSAQPGPPGPGRTAGQQSGGHRARPASSQRGRARHRPVQIDGQTDLRSPTRQRDEEVFDLLPHPGRRIDPQLHCLVRHDPHNVDGNAQRQPTGDPYQPLPLDHRFRRPDDPGEHNIEAGPPAWLAQQAPDVGGATGRVHPVGKPHEQTIGFRANRPYGSPGAAPGPVIGDLGFGHPLPPGHRDAGR